jgi:hypothetical protein
MDIGFFYECKKGVAADEKTTVVLYYKKEAFDILAGLIYPAGIDEETFNNRVEFAVKQSMDKICEISPNTGIDDPKGVEGVLKFYDNKRQVPETVAGWISLVESIGEQKYNQLPGYA